MSTKPTQPTNKKSDADRTITSRAVDAFFGQSEPAPEHETHFTGCVRSTLVPTDSLTGHPIRLDLVFQNSVGLRRLAATYGEGEAKYGPGNWMKGFPESIYLNHALDHLRLYSAGDRTEDHIAHAVWNLFTLCWVQEVKPELLDLSHQLDKDNQLLGLLRFLNPAPESRLQ